MTSANQPYRVVVGIDFSGTSLPAFTEALRQVQARPGEELHLVHVLWKSPAAPGGIANDDARLDDAYRRLRAFVLEYESENECQLEPQVQYHARIGDYAEGIHQVAVDVDADLIVVGTAGLRGVERMLLGSVAEKVMRTARLPVLVARRKNLDGLPRSATPEPARPDEDLTEQRRDILRSTEIVALECALSDPHIAGMV